MQNRETFQICRKNSKSQMAWHHNGQKYFFRFFRLRISQFEKINEKKNFENFQIFRKNSKSQVTWPGNGKFRTKFFLLHIWNQNASIRKKKQKKFFFDFLTLGDDHWWRHHKGMWPLEAKLDFVGRSDLHGSKGLC